MSLVNNTINEAVRNPLLLKLLSMELCLGSHFFGWEVEAFGWEVEAYYLCKSTFLTKPKEWLPRLPTVASPAFVWSVGHTLYQSHR